MSAHDRVAHRRTLLGVLIFCVLAFGPGVRGSFVWDDALLVEGNTLTASLHGVARAFREDLWASAEGTAGPTGYYRPFLLLDLALDRALFGLWASAHRLHSLAWHLAAVALLAGVLRRLHLPVAATAVGLALFALHPVQVEPVLFVSARNDPMATALLLGALTLLLPGERAGAPRGLAAGLLVLAAALSKESVLLAPLLLAAVAWARTGGLGGVRAHAAMLGGLAAYALLRAWSGVALPPGVGPRAALEVLGPALALQVRGLFWPMDLLPGTHLGWPPPIPWAALVAGGLVAVALGLAGGRRAWAGLAWAAVAWLPASVAVARLGLVSDRYLYLPMVGLALTAAAAAARLRSARLQGVLAAGLLLGLGAATAATVPAWRDDPTLWAAAAAAHPNPYTWGTYAKVLEGEGELDQAAEWYARAVAPPRPFAESCFNAAAVHLKRGDPGAAARAGRDALAAGCAPSPELLAPTALGLALSGEWVEAEALAERVARDPTGKAVLVRLAAAARRGDLGPLLATAGEPAERAALAAQVAYVLDQAGEVEASGRVRAAVPAP